MIKRINNKSLNSLNKSISNNGQLKSFSITSTKNIINNHSNSSYNNNSSIINFNNNNNNNNKFVNRYYSSNHNHNHNHNHNYNYFNKEQNVNNNIEKSEKIYNCKVVGTSRSYKTGIESLPNGFILQKVFEPSNVRWLVNEESNRDVYVFPTFGCVVSWGLNDDELESILKWLKPYEINPFPALLNDTYRYKISSQSVRFEITKTPLEVLTLSKSEREQEIEKFASSYALAQSVTLFPLEDRVQHTSKIVEDISITGRQPKVEILKQLGEQLLVKSSINLRSDFETPEFFWENTEGENIYTMVRAHCEIGKRIRIMNEKLDLITNIYDIINDEQRHKHSIRLERIIIFLIGMEIFITLLKEYRDHLEKQEEKQKNLA